MDSFESTKLDWESSSSGSGGSHFEFSCTQDVSDMLCDIGVNEPVDWGVDDIMIRIWWWWKIKFKKVKTNKQTKKKKKKV